jgi:aerobic-type carbon monoxide dehydrogenase small subunit (CoxS/CutS family)
MKKSIQFNLNGKQVSILVNGEESLLTVLRSYLEHTGTKFGCGLGQCGACTVLINKEPIQSCMTSIEDVEGKDILTIEGLSSDEALHPIQKAFVGHDALQCGFCTPGMIMNAYGLLLRDPEPSREKIISEMEGNLCRCGSYNRIIDAIQTAAEEMKEKI